MKAITQRKPVGKLGSTINCWTLTWNESCSLQSGASCKQKGFAESEIKPGSFPNQYKILVFWRDIFTSGTASQCWRLIDRHLPETVDSVLRVVELDCRAGSQIQGSDWLLTLQQRHSASARTLLLFVWCDLKEVKSNTNTSISHSNP